MEKYSTMEIGDHLEMTQRLIGSKIVNKKAFLEKKHSSGDLQSRLKTRKILGVGETDNGDIHRSKISQVLGHNEHLYVKFPKCYSFWHLTVAILYTAIGLMNLMVPDGADVPLMTSSEKTEAVEPNNVTNRLYGSSVLGCAVLLWTLWKTSDKSLARVLMAAVGTSELLHFVVLCSHSWHSEIEQPNEKLHIAVHLIALMGSCYFFIAIGSSTAGLRKSPSYKDLREAGLEHQTSVEQMDTATSAKKTE